MDEVETPQRFRAVCVVALAMSGSVHDMNKKNETY